MVLKNLFLGQQWRNRHREQTFTDTGREKERMRCGKSDPETYIIICKIDSQWESALCVRKLKQGLCINLEGWDGEGDRRDIQEGGDISIYIDIYRYMYLWLIHVEV